MFGKRFSRALAVTTVASLVMAAAAFAADLKADASLSTGIQTTVDVGTKAGGLNLTHDVLLFVQGGGPVSYPFTVAASGATGAITGATDVELTAGGDTNGKNSTVSYTVPCTAGAFSGTITFTAPESSNLGDRSETVTINGTATACASAGDETPPANASISINDGAAWTNTTAVTVDISATDNVGVTGYALAATQADLPSAPTVTFAADDDYSAADVPFTLAGPDGTNSAWVRFFDAAGNSADASDTIGLDRIAPTVTCVPASFLLNEPSANVSANVTDALSLPVSATVSESADTTTAGTSKSVSLTGYDNAGNSTTVSCSYSVGYNFEGLYAPVDRPNTMNVSKAGQAIPLKWRLTDFYGVGVTNVTSVTVGVGALACSSTANLDTVEEYAGSSGLQNLGDGYYQFNWKTPTSYANTCKTLSIKMGTAASDAPVYSNLANFSFKK